LKYLKLVIFLAVMTVIAGCNRTSFQDAQGNSLNWDDFRGQWVVVNYWAEWCKPCIEEIPELNELNQSPDVTVLGVNFDGVTGDALTRLGNKMNIDYQMLAEDPGPVLGWKLPVGLPASFVVDPDGKLIETRFGPQTEASLQALFSESPNEG
tara:strand:+ start:141 stop:596 length:456 start_codon:yes stop_codon:yes gene_type:complete